MSLKNIYQQLFDPVDEIFAFLSVLFHQSNLFENGCFAIDEYHLNTCEPEKL